MSIQKSLLEDAEKALTVHLEEYKSIREDITSFISHENQLVNYSIAIIGGTITLLTITIGGQNISVSFPIVILIASMLLSAISWALVEVEFQIHDLGSYLSQSVYPKIKILVSNQDRFEFSVLEWETERRKRPIRVLIRGILGMGKFLVSYIPSVVFVILFYFLRSTILIKWFWYETVIFWVSGFMVTIVPLAVIINLVYMRIYSQKGGKSVQEKNNITNKPK